MTTGFAPSRLRQTVSLLAVGLTLAAWANPGGALAQDVADNVQSSAEEEIPTSEIIITARKRAETVMDVPASVTALGAAQLETYATKDLHALATRVPSLIVAQVTGGSGGSISLRGISSSATNPSIDQAVAVNMDGVQLGSAYMVRLAQIDLQQIEVLKGPQALFFGKNSPGGVISYTSVDPGDSFDGYVKVGHEFEAREYTGEAAIGGPLTDTLKGRVTVFGTTMEGDRINKAPVIPALGALGPDRRRAPQRDEFFVRGTLVFEPSDRLKARAKYNFSKLKGSSPWHTGERIYCPNGAPAVGGLGPLIAVDDCKANGVFYQGKRIPSLTAPYAAEFGDEATRTTQHLASLEVNYELAPEITATSITGYYKVHDRTYGNSFYAPVSLIISGTDIKRRDFTEEFRIATDRSEWPVNFTVGAFYQDTKFANATPVVLDRFGLVPTVLVPGTPQPLFFAENFVDTEAYSFFGQAIWKITDTLELAGGARWSHEKKKLTVFLNRGYGGGQFFPAVDDVKFTDTSPEVTLSWRPNRDLMVFGAFRNGFKSGGFNTSGNTATLSPDQSYKPENAMGFEGGVKYQNGPIRFSVTAYTYKYEDVQVSTFDPIRVAQLVTNAASARVKGIEADVDWYPVEGLNLHGAINYNHGRYKEFLVGCYTGQTIAEGCDRTPGVGGRFQQQDFAGRQLYLSPDWVGSAGFNYSRPISSGLKLMLSGDAVYKSSYFADLEQAPGGKQDDSWMFNASIRLADHDDRWELAFIGENLTEVYRSSLTAQVSRTGIATRTGTNIPGGLSDLNGQINRGRQLRAQFTYRFR